PQINADTERAFRARGAVGCIVKPPTQAAVDRIVRAVFRLPDGSATAPTIHIVDPDARSGKVLRRELEARLPGCRGGLFESAIDALFTLPVERPDLLLVDVTEPDVNPTALIRRLAARAGELPILAMCPARAESLGSAAVAAGARGALQKPCNVDD